jgi:tetratricopeptide (TPR) repeat protein
MAKIKTLFLAANPNGTIHLALDEEIREISDKIRLSEGRDVLDIVTAWAVRPDDLLQYLNQYKPQIVHFSGHGSDAGEIILVDNKGDAKSVSSRALKKLFTTLRDNIQIVFLNACYSRIQGEAINKVIDYVIGMNKEVGDRAAIVFAASFYRALGFDRTIQEAFDQAITALLLEGIPEEDTPVLLVRHGASPHKRIFAANFQKDAEQKEPHAADSMWIALVDVVEQRWKERPRQELVRSVVNLRNAMIGCQKWYDKYKKAADHSDIHTLPDPRVEWVRSLTDLGRNVAALDQVLSIFSPETRRHIQDYLDAEDLEVGAIETLGPAAEELGGSTDFDIKNVQLKSSFDAALEKLDRFIRENFKPEEIHSISLTDFLRPDRVAYTRSMEYDYFTWQGKALIDQGKYDEAIKVLDKAIELRPKYAAEAWHNKGDALEALGKTTEANTAFARAKEQGYRV